MPLRLIILIVGFALLNRNTEAQNLDSLYSGGKAAYDSGMYEESIAFFNQFEKVRTNYPPVVMYLAMLYSRTGASDKAIDYLGRTAIINADTNFLAREDFDPIRSSKAFGKIKSQFQYMIRPIRHSEQAFSLEDRNLHPEAMAYDAERSRFFIGSIRKRSIVIYESGRSYTFKAQAEDSLLAVTGLAIDREEGLLWVTSASFPEMALQDSATVGSYVHVYDILTGTLLRRFHLGKEVLLGDLMISSKGDVYMTNSRKPEIYRATIDSLYRWKEFPNLRNLQGIAEGTRGEIFFSDYIHGIYRLSAETIRRLKHADTLSLKGIDGLYYKNGKLVGLQNGVYPKRVVQFTLNEDHTGISSGFYLDKNLPALNEPVQGVWVGDWFYFIANSPWPYYDEDLNLPADTPMPEIWRTNLVR